MSLTISDTISNVDVFSVNLVARPGYRCSALRIQVQLVQTKVQLQKSNSAGSSWQNGWMLLVAHDLLRSINYMIMR